jgi:protein-S-isoprenylcysteine O-methyltransferase Ste14
MGKIFHRTERPGLPRSPATFSWFNMGLALSCTLLATVGQAAFVVWLLLLGLGLPVASDLLEFPWCVLWKLGLLLLFALQHSGMARQRIKDWLTRFIPAPLERSVYVALSGLLMLAFVLTWQATPGPSLWELPTWVSAISVLGALAVAWITFFTDPARLLGLRQAWEAGREEATPDVLKISGPYRFVRHPQMAALLVFLWGHAVMTPTLMFLSTGLTVYVLVAIQLEETDLRRRFGTPYWEYRRRVPALIPWRAPVPPMTYPESS